MYRELTMTDVREVLRRWQAEQSIKSIARGTRIDRKTVRRYIEMAEQIGIDKRAVLTDAVVHEIAQSVQSRALPQPSDAWRNVEEHRAQIEQWIVEDLRLSRMHALLVRSGVSDVTYATLRRYAMQELGWRKEKQATSAARRSAGRTRGADRFCGDGSRGDRRAEAPTVDLDRDARVESLQLHMADAFADDARSNRRAGSGVEVFRRDAEDARAGQREPR